jgi:hypothetical protein
MKDNHSLGQAVDHDDFGASAYGSGQQIAVVGRRIASVDQTNGASFKSQSEL